MKFFFDSAGRIMKMVSESHYDDMDGFSTTFEIFPDAAGEIDAKIQSRIQNLYVSSFSWKDAKAKYATDEFNHRDNGFVNNDMVSIDNPVDAARRALKEYPKLGDYLSLDVSHDDGANMWRVTVKSYHDYQSTDEYRDIYLDDNGVTRCWSTKAPLVTMNRGSRRITTNCRCIAHYDTPAKQFVKEVPSAILFSVLLSIS